MVTASLTTGLIYEIKQIDILFGNGAMARRHKVSSERLGLMLVVLAITNYGQITSLVGRYHAYITFLHRLLQNLCLSVQGRISPLNKNRIILK